MKRFLFLSTIFVLSFICTTLFAKGEDHFWTTDKNGELLSKPPWELEGDAFWVIAPNTQNPPNGSIPLYRFYSRKADIHFWTTDPHGEGLPSDFVREMIVALVFAKPKSGTVPVYRFYDGATFTHFGTTSRTGELLPQPPFVNENEVFYAYTGSSHPQADWIIPFWRFYKESVSYTWHVEPANVSPNEPVATFIVDQDENHRQIRVQFYGGTEEVKITGPMQLDFIQSQTLTVLPGNYTVKLLLFKEGVPGTYAQVTYDKRQKR